MYRPVNSQMEARHFNAQHNSASALHKNKKSDQTECGRRTGRNFFVNKLENETNNLKKKKKSCLVSAPCSITVSVVLHFTFATSLIEHEKKESFPFESVEVLVSRCLI